MTKDTWEHRRARMRTSPSRAELAVFLALQRRVGPGVLEPLGTTVCFNPHDGVQIVPRERMTVALWERCMREGFVTVPDFTLGPQRRAFYLDGEPHTHARVKLRDEHIDSCLAQVGWQATRFPYMGRMSQRQEDEIVDTIAKEAVS